MIRNNGDILKNCLREALNEKEYILATRINSTWPMIIEQAGLSGMYDYVEFLAEYAPFGQHDLENLARAAELHHLGIIAKIDYANRTYVAQKALASGFTGFLFTDHVRADEVKETILSLRADSPKYQGQLGFVNRRFIKNATFPSQMGYADDVAQTVMGFMIEKKEAVDNIEEICQVPGVDFVQFGPADFSMNSGFDKADNEELVKEAETKVIQTALKYGVSPRVEIRHASDADYYRAMGVKHFCLGSEIRILRDFWQDEGADLLKRVQAPTQG